MAIYRFNLAALLNKVGWQELADRIPLPQKNTSNRELPALLREPKRAGLDISSEFILIEYDPGTPTSPHLRTSFPMTGQPAATLRPKPDSLSYTSLLLHLSDSARFGAFLREMEPGLHIIQDSSKNNRAGKDRMGAAWNKDIAILTFAQGPPSPVQGTTPTMTAKPVATPILPAIPVPPSYAPQAMRQSQVLLNGYPDSVCIRDSLLLKSFAGDSLNGFADESDIQSWTLPGHNLSLLLQGLLHLKGPPACPVPFAAGSPIGGKSSPNNPPVHVLSSLRFENGRILLKSLTPLPPGTDSPYARLTDRPFPDRLVARIPPGNILAMVNLHFNPALMGNWLESLQARGQMEALLFDKGVSLEGFEHAFNGDFLLAAVQPESPVPAKASARHDSSASAPSKTLTPEPPAATASTAKALAPAPAPSLSFPFAVPLRDLTAFRGWTEKLNWFRPSPVVSAAETGRGNPHHPIGRRIGAYLLLDSGLVSGSSPEQAAAWFRDSALRDTGFIPPALRDSPLGGWVDMKRLTRYLRRLQAPVSEKQTLLLPVLEALDQLIFTGGRLNESRQLENRVEIKFNDANSNSLRTLFKLVQ